MSTDDKPRPVEGIVGRAPVDFEHPDWGKRERVHCWRNYISDDLQRMWPLFSVEQRAAVACNADDIAGREHWD